ncbi:response regulator transcription factor [Streptococcus thermophilus]|uniref:LytR/AlgR family response regulator transcription factor n=1 Tax=Streptococcus thermophilus TaxID=1308 RepID=UPI0022FE8EEF|nr:response regulator transcription factor [Streptococcus thermophilus]MDA5519861.1 response regulator transcription factor [Streptococcus thermophilus]MDW2957345.1 response regulator transcription factor [Streptococcus thermophilus]
MDIFVLEDDIPQQFRMERAINLVMESNNWHYRYLEISSNPDEIIAVAGNGEHQIFFLDLEIKGKEQQGIDVAKAIREKNSTAIIVFVTTHSEFMLLTYQSLVGAIDFIDKGLNEEAFNERLFVCLKEAVKRQEGNFGEHSYLFHTPQAKVRVAYDDILFFETSPAPHRIILHTKNERTEFYATIAEVAKSDERLFRCHRSFVVNVDNIARFDMRYKLIYFEMGETCPVARAKVKLLQEKIE